MSNATETALAAPESDPDEKPGGIFEEKTTPKKLGADDKMMKMFLKCPGTEDHPCGNVHFRHAGYVKTAVPYVEADLEQKVAQDQHQVSVCTKCRRAYIWIKGQAYDMTDQIDLEAWSKTEEDMHKALGPGGMDC